MFSSKSFIVSGLTFRYLIHLEFIFVYGVRMEKALAPHSSTLAWKIPWAEEPGGLQSMGSQRVRHNLNDLKYTQAVCVESNTLFFPGQV